MLEILVICLVVNVCLLVLNVCLRLWAQLRRKFELWDTEVEEISNYDENELEKSEAKTIKINRTQNVNKKRRGKQPKIFQTKPAIMISKRIN